MTKRNKQLLISWTIHASILCTAIILFVSVAYFYRMSLGVNYYNTDGSLVTTGQYLFNHIQDLLLIIGFTLLIEVNYQYLFEKLPWAFYTLCCLLIGIISLILLIILNREQITLQGIASVVQPALWLSAYAFIYSLLRDYYYQSRHKKELLLQNFESELYTLKAQLTPHFLFNSLNYLYGTALKEEAHHTADGIETLSEMLRYTITAMNDDYVSLAKELNFIEQYIALQKVRVSNTDIQTDIKIQADLQSLHIPPLLLLPFIENAFKYGISIDKPSPIKIKISVEKQALTMEVFNRIVEGQTEVKGNNTGIRNTLKRLDLLYPDSYKLDCRDFKTTYQVSLYLPLK